MGSPGILDFVLNVGRCTSIHLLYESLSPLFFVPFPLWYFLLLCVALVLFLSPDECAPLAPTLCALEELDVQPGAGRGAGPDLRSSGA